MLKYFVGFVLLQPVKTPSEFLDYIVQELLFFTCFPGYLRYMFTVPSTSYSLHGNYVLSLPSLKITTCGLQSFSCMVSKLWNSPPDFFRISNFSDFKRKILQYMTPFSTLKF